MKLITLRLLSLYTDLGPATATIPCFFTLRIACSVLLRLAEKPAWMGKETPSQQDFEKLLLWLDPNRDRAGEKYTKIQLRLIKIFSSRGCAEVEDLADKTFNVIISKIDWLLENYVGDPAIYFYAVAKNIYLETLKKRPPPEPPPIDPTPPDFEDVCAQLDECLRELSSADRTLVLGYHEGEKQEKIKNRKKLAEELKTSRNALRIKVHYIHARLRECIERLQQQAPKLNETPWAQ